jgi:hypothetical protein
MSTIPHHRFYVYALARPFKKDWKVFYIGKGTKRRVFAHEDEARRGYKSHRHNIIRKVWREGAEIQRYILFTTDDEQEAYEYEKDMIAFYGRENLANLTDGGAGPVGYVIPQDVRDRITAGLRAYCNSPRGKKQRSETTRRMWLDSSRKANFRRIMRAYWSNPEYKARVRAKMNASLQSPEYRAAAREQAKIRWSDPEYREKATRHNRLPEYRAAAAAKTKQMFEDPAERERMSRTTTEQWQDSEWRERVTESIRASRKRPEYLAKASAAAKARFAVPEARAANSERMKDHFSKPGVRESTRERMKAKWQDPEYRTKMMAARAKRKKS